MLPHREDIRRRRLQATTEMLTFANEVLSSEELERADLLAQMINSPGVTRRQAITELLSLTAPPPKRPLYYLRREFAGLPTWTRNCVRYLGDYIDMLAKHLAYQVTGISQTKKRSLGANVYAMKKSEDVSLQPLLRQLALYDSLFRKSAEHDMTVPQGREHRFTSREVIICAFITMRLASEVKAITHCLPELNCHYDSLPTQPSPTEVGGLSESPGDRPVTPLSKLRSTVLACPICGITKDSSMNLARHMVNDSSPSFGEHFAFIEKTTGMDLSRFIHYKGNMRLLARLLEAKQGRLDG